MSGFGKSKISEEALRHLKEIEDPLRKEFAVLQLRKEWEETGFRERATLSTEEKELINRLVQFDEDTFGPGQPINEHLLLELITGKKTILDIMPGSPSEQQALYERVAQNIRDSSLPDEEKIRLSALAEALKEPTTE